MFFKIKVYIINIIRKLTKSIGKKEKKIIYYLKYLRWKKNFPYKDILWDENYLNKFEFNNVDYKDILPKKIAICICFYFNESKLDLLSQTCNAIYTISDNIDLTIITNANENKKKRTNY